MTASRADSTPASAGGWTLTGWHVLGVVVGFFAIIIALDVWFMTLAYKTFPGQVSETPYEDGVAFNQRLAQQDAQARLGWSAAAAADPSAVRVELRDAQGAPVRGLEVTGRLERPATEAGRLTLRFSETAPGRYAAPVRSPSGTWDLTFTARGSGGQAFEGARRLAWP
ncbi:MAG: FixH family protein [Phenylobacterium sp.]